MDCTVFNQISDVIVINDKQLLDQLKSPEFSVTLWVYIDNDEGTRSLIRKQNQFSIGICGDKILVSNDWKWDKTKVFIPLKTWSHVSVTYNSIEYKVYINGTISYTQKLKSNFVINNEVIMLGFKGEKPKMIKMCEVALFLRELSSDDILEAKNGNYIDVLKLWKLDSLNIEHSSITGAESPSTTSCYKESVYKYNQSSFINNAKYSDLKIYGNDNQFLYAHKLIVCHQCNILETMITTESEIKFDLPYDILFTFIKYLYTGTVKINSDNVLQLYLLSDQYIIPLKYECEKYMSSQLTITNIFEYYVLSYTHNSPFLNDKCLEWMNTHYKDIVTHPSFYDMDKQFIQKFLTFVK